MSGQPAARLGRLADRPAYALARTAGCEAVAYVHAFPGGTHGFGL